MRDVFNKLIRRVLALTIRCPKKPKTKGDILRYSLKSYIKNPKTGLCAKIKLSLSDYAAIVCINYSDISTCFPLFRKDIAIQHFNGRNGIYWWPIKDWKSRYRYMRWLIREYNNVKL